MGHRIEDDLGKQFLSDHIGFGFDAQHGTGQGLTTARTQHDARWQPTGQPGGADLVETHVDPQTLGVDNLHHGLAGDDGRSGVGITHHHHTVNRRDQAQIALLRDEAFAVSACPGNIFARSGQGCIGNLQLLPLGGGGFLAGRTQRKQLFIAARLGLCIDLPGFCFAQSRLRPLQGRLL